ncbi:hypothetical protein DEO72_LG5g2241 [Vigna unguiculata]|uniref:Uncharacterized protein n=1 Tax=Vigna unguiculata TaxID=3917 RepID=A0A4D6M0U4_VIGUN|nr:hypothetical protein DEO72_LG5g2241 [Vigna unguiculata]
MSPSHSCSSYTCNGWGMKNSSVSSHAGVVRRFDLTLVCYCGEKAITRTARIAKNRGENFEIAQKFKCGGEEVVGYNFFSWCSENVIEERCGRTMKNDDDSDGTTMKMVEKDGERKLLNIEKYVLTLEKWVKVLFGIVCFLYVLNIFLFTMLLKIP